MASSLVGLVSTLVLGAGSAFAVWSQDPVGATDQYESTMNASINNRLNYNIPVQSLRQALLAYGKLTGLQISTDPAAIAGIKAPALEGKYTQHQALEKLISGSKLSIRYIDNTSVVVTPPNPVYAQADNNIQLGSSVLLNPIEVEDGADEDASSGSGFQGTPDWVYETPDSVSVISREAIQNMPNRNARDLLDSVSGVYANRSEAQDPGISINIRGLQDQDRIITMIDGARQNFQRSGHGATQRTYVDTAFIRQVDVEKSSTSGVGSAGSLGGSVNFRTIIASDLIDEGKQWGAEFNATTGSNEFKFDGSGSAAFRMSDTISVVAGISHKKIGAFDIGKKGDLIDLSINTINTGALLFSGQEVFTTLLKAEIDVSSDAKVTFGWMRNESDFSTGQYQRGGVYFGESRNYEDIETVTNNTYTAALDWNPDNDLINLKLKAYYNDIKDNEEIDSLYKGRNSREFTFNTLGATLENTSIFKTDFGSISFNYGAEAFHDEGETKLTSTFTDNGQDVSGVYTGGTPSGDRDLASGFVSGKLEYGNWLTASAGLRYDRFESSGTADIYGRKRGGVYPKYTVDVDMSGNSGLLPTFEIAVKPTDWLQPFVKYSKSYRPPTIMESFINSGHDSTLSANAPNPYLEPETAKTLELGVNIFQNGVFTNDDKFRLKAVSFRREIENYITIGEIYRTNNGVPHAYNSYVNLEGTTTMKGFEVEGSYDAGLFYLGGSYTFNRTDWADRYYVTLPNGQVGVRYLRGGRGPTVLFVQPRHRLVLDAGIRLFDQKLTLGGRLTDVAPTEPTLGSLLPARTFGMKEYQVYDIYGSYKFNDTVKLGFAVNNLEDLGYVSAMGVSYYAAPGRTATVSLNLKF